MRGNAKIINSVRDAIHIGLTRDQIIAAATITVSYDDAIYPSDYDRNLKDGDDGFITPIMRTETIVDQAVLDRFGVKL